MLKFLKRIFRKDETAPTPSVTAAPVAVHRAVEKPVANGVEVASLSLRAILEKLPQELHAIVNQMPDPEVKIMLPVNTILKQLPSGAVRMSLASLLRQAPQGTFRKSEVEEKQMVDVPLSEIFKNVDAKRLGRRSDQRRYDVPDDATGLFGKTGSSRSVTDAAAAAPEVLHPEPAMPAASAQQAAPAPAPVPPVAQSRIVKMPGLTPAAQATSNGNGHAHSPAPAPAITPKAKAAPPAGGTGEVVISFVELAAGWPEGIRSEFSLVSGDTKLVIPAQAVGPGLQKGKVAFPWSQVRMWMRPGANCPIAIADDLELVFPLKIIAPAFVAATGATKRREAAEIDHSLPDFFGPTAGHNTKPEQPAPTPAPPAPPVAAAPITIATPPAPEPAEVPETPAAAEAPPLKFTLVRDEPVALPQAAPEPAPLTVEANAGLAPTSTPSEIVQRACAIPGVAGALIALEEGLVIAQNLPDGFSAETFAAFMPQIFGRLEKYTAEMRLGTATEITIQSEHGPCHIARRGKIYFGTLGHAGERLPESLGNLTAQLATLNS
jgi:predicted regulator of Ras-like GTPase activity (Roadblock/LC7/MglB family)